MQPNDFQSTRAGRLMKTTQGYWAFDPFPLPPEIPASWSLFAEVSIADRALSELAGLARTLPNPHLLIRPFLQREAVLSSRIEGTQASLSDLFFHEASPSVNTRGSDVREVANYVHALEYGLDRLNEFPLSMRLIREMHERLMSGVRGETMTPGEFRRSQNWIGAPGCTLMNAVFVPPPVAEMQKALNGLENYLHAPSDLPALVRLALIHYQFEVIHPFLDGNGRIGRLLLVMLLCTEGLLPQPLLYLSAYFEQHRQEYYDGLLGVSRAGRWREWVAFFVRGVAEQSRDALLRAGRLLDLQKEYREILTHARVSPLALQLMDSLFSNPVVTVGRAAELLGTTPRSAQANIQKLVLHGILAEATGRQRNRIFAASRIVNIVEANEVG